MDETASVDPVKETRKDPNSAIPASPPQQNARRHDHERPALVRRCRPSCGARTPRPENVAFHSTAADAKQAGFRACRRCKPDQRSLAEEHAAKVAELCRLIQSADSAPTLRELSARAGGAEMPIRFAVGECSLGSILVARSDRGVCAILLGDDPDALARELQDRFPRADLIGGDGELEALVARVVGFVEADETERAPRPRPQ